MSILMNREGRAFHLLNFASSTLTHGKTLIRRTCKRLRNSRDRFPGLHNRLASDITHRDLEPLLAPISPGGRNLVMRHLRSFFNFGIKRGFLTQNPSKEGSEAFHAIYSPFVFFF